MKTVLTACNMVCAAILRNKVHGNAGGSPEAQEKRKKTCLERYGVENGAQADVNKEKAKRALTEKYGGVGLSSPMLKEKARQTNLKKYGVENPFQSEKAMKLREAALANPEVRRKFERTCLERYGSTSPLGSPEVRQKTRRTCRERWRVDWPSQAPEVKEKVAKTVQERYGGCVYNSSAVREKAMATNRERYGVDYPSQSPKVQKKIEATMNERYGGILLSSPILKQRIHKTNLEKYGVPVPSMLAEFRKTPTSAISKLNVWWHKHLPGSQLEFPLGRYSYDLLYQNTLIEIDPTYTHNSTTGPVLSYGIGEPKAPDYHLQKTLEAEKYGYSCMHVFDQDNYRGILYLLTRAKKPVSAHKCQLTLLDTETAADFLDTYHLQGSSPDQEFCVGLLYNDELIAVMTFRLLDYNSEYNYELLRYAADRKIYGGAQKMFSAFTDSAEAQSVISYCDRSKFKGTLYYHLGFQLESSTQPVAHWFNDQTYEEAIDTSQTPEQLLDNGFEAVYDCGQLVSVWKSH